MRRGVFYDRCLDERLLEVKPRPSRRVQLVPDKRTSVHDQRGTLQLVVSLMVGVVDVNPTLPLNMETKEGGGFG